MEPGGPPGPGELVLAGPGRVLRALAPGVAALRTEIAAVEAGYLDALERPFP